MAIDNRDHTHDIDPDQECPGCGEVIRAPEQHTCAPIGWSTHCEITDQQLTDLMRQEPA